MRKKKAPPKCPHPDEEISGRWQYSGDKLVSGAGYCGLCGVKHKFCVVADKLVPEEDVKEPLDKTDYWWLLLQAKRRGEI